MPVWIIDTGEETVEGMVESIAKARIEDPCPEGAYCNPQHHVWETAHPDDKEWGRDNVRFVLKELGVVG